jgi:hypothetical protein
MLQRRHDVLLSVAPPTALAVAFAVSALVAHSRYRQLVARAEAAARWMPDPSSDAPKEPGPAAATNSPPPATPPPEQNAGQQNEGQASSPAAEEPPADPAGASAPPDAPPSGPKRSLKECTSLWDGMQQKVASFDASHRACKSDADCATAPGRVCLGACETAVSKGAVKERDALFKKIGETECKAFMGGCSSTLPIPIPSCPMYVPVCAGGKCTAEMKR